MRTQSCAKCGEPISGRPAACPRCGAGFSNVRLWMACSLLIFAMGVYAYIRA